jgi:hypothetical protein
MRWFPLNIRAICVAILPGRYGWTDLDALQRSDYRAWLSARQERGLKASSTACLCLNRRVDGRRPLGGLCRV